MELGRFGIWWSGTWQAGATPGDQVAAEMEQLGYGTLWASAGFERGIPRRFGDLLEWTERAVVATGILSVWPNDPAEVAAEAASLGPRFLLGLGASHAPLVERSGEQYRRPRHKVAEFLDGLDAAGTSPPRILAALGDRMLRLAGERSLGAHPYFVPLEHTAHARQVLGEGPLLTPELAVVLSDVAADARALARGYTTGYLRLSNYAGNLLALGWSPDDLQAGGSDRLVDAVVAWGTAERVAERIREHLEAGADHVCIQVVHGTRDAFPLAEYRELAAALV